MKKKLFRLASKKSHPDGPKSIGSGCHTIEHLDE
jgi:hypothetical protein